MENESDDKKIISVRIKKKTETKTEPTVLFNQSDIRKFVLEFIASWIRGDLIIRFPTAAELAEKNTSEHSFPN